MDLCGDQLTDGGNDFVVIYIFLSLHLVIWAIAGYGGVRTSALLHLARTRALTIVFLLCEPWVFGCRRRSV